eukprot:12101912-Karenia_brevis.AAC.1
MVQEELEALESKVARACPMPAHRVAMDLGDGVVQTVLDAAQKLLFKLEGGGLSTPLGQPSESLVLCTQNMRKVMEDAG